MSIINKRKLAVILHGALICSVVGFLLTTNFLRDLRYFRDKDKTDSYVVDCDDIYPISHSEIYLAAVDIPAGSAIVEEMLFSVIIPTDLRVEFYIQTSDINSQSTAVVDIRQGMILTSDLIR